MARNRKVLAVGIGAAAAAAVAAAAVGIQVTVSDVNVTSVSGSAQFSVTGDQCDADVSFTNGTFESINGGSLYIWDYTITTPAGGTPCGEILVQGTESNGSAAGDPYVGLYTPGWFGGPTQFASLDTGAGSGTMSIGGPTNPDFDRLVVTGNLTPAPLPPPPG